MYQIEISHLDLEQIAQSGQCFRWKRLGEGHFSVVAFDRYLEMRQNGTEFTFSCDEEEWKRLWYGYFDMDTDYGEIAERILSSEDDYLKRAYRYGSGIRVLRQDLWEIIVSFVISQNNNIKRITNSIDRLCTDYGISCENAPLSHCFPKAEAVGEECFENAAMGFGYRNTYLRELFEYVREHRQWLQQLQACNYEEAMELLLARKGIGKKVANCICLFGLHHVEAFPIDTHIRQILEAHYPNGFDFERYRGIAGIIQQYMFYEKLTRKDG